MARALVFVGLVCLAFTAAGAASGAEETDAVTGRQLLTGGGQWVWYPTQVQVNGGGNYANNVGTANQQSNNQAVQQYGWGNSGGNVNSQSINTAPVAKDPGPKGRKLLGEGQWVWYPTQFQANGGGNYANNVGTANQQSNNQAVQQFGGWNVGGNSNSQSINTAPTKAGPEPPKGGPGGRKLLTSSGYWAWYPTQVQVNGGGNIAKNAGTVNQQSNNQAVQQAGGWNFGVNSNSQSITTDPPKDAKKP
ncbi:hypothetical protein WJX73_010751 [Symbiochloris irregularis]|uniref:Uncharacterized protein n=1 Tax=Symbiochloris irregularis TaxID=706552 RepID=A0AAW1PBN5_9CHLO